ncbi:hypothetical protein MMC17_001990 [Xylographa soralifera]|nr:hypothetical protein [Xylographa soralifera]
MSYRQSGTSDRDEKPKGGRPSITSSHRSPLQYSENASYLGPTQYTGSIKHSSNSHYQPSLTTSGIPKDRNNPPLVGPSAYQGAVSTTSYKPLVQSPYYSNSSTDSYTSFPSIYDYASSSSVPPASPYSEASRSTQYSSTTPYYGARMAYSKQKDVERNELAYVPPRYPQTLPPLSSHRVGDKVWNTRDGSGPYTVIRQDYFNGTWICRCRKEDDDPNDPNRAVTKEITGNDLKRQRFLVGDRVNIKGSPEEYVVMAAHYSEKDEAFKYVLRGRGPNFTEFSHVDRNTLFRA